MSEDNQADGKAEMNAADERDDLLTEIARLKGIQSGLADDLMRAHGKLRRAEGALTEIRELCKEASAGSHRRNAAIPVIDVLAIIDDSRFGAR